jgi:hypothetical protein
MHIRWDLNLGQLGQGEAIKVVDDHALAVHHAGSDLIVFHSSSPWMRRSTQRVWASSSTRSTLRGSSPVRAES